MTGKVIAVARSAVHSFSKPVAADIRLVVGLGVEGDAHAGMTVRHRSRVAIDPTQPNLRQVHLIQCELFAELGENGFEIVPGDMGENITTRGIDLLGLPVGARLRIGAGAEIVITGLRNPCRQLDAFRQGLMAAVLGRTADGAIVRKAGIMGVVAAGGWVRPDDGIEVLWPPLPHRALERV